MQFLIAFLVVLPFASAQFPGFGQRPVGGFGGRGGFNGGGPLFQSGGERSYYVRGRLVCGIQGAQGARVSLWENRAGGGQPDVHDEDVIDASGTVSLKAEIRGSSGGGTINLEARYSEESSGFNGGGRGAGFGSGGRLGGFGQFAGLPQPIQ
ncbi:hypothetical protein OSTOST_06795 [Ostertagia ostertagi]